MNVDIKPGKTKYLQNIILNEKVELIDCPGLIFPTVSVNEHELYIYGVKMVDNLKSYIDVMKCLTERISLQNLSYFYGIIHQAQNEREFL